jgi:hypothetical protein
MVAIFMRETDLKIYSVSKWLKGSPEERQFIIAAVQVVNY